MCVVSGCIVMTDATRKRTPKGRAAQSCAGPTAACRSTLRCGRAPGAGLLYFAASSLPLPRTSSASEGAGSATGNQTGLYGQAPKQPDSASPSVRNSQRLVDQRGGQPSIARAVAARARAWVSRNQFGNAHYSWNIGSIVCCRISSPRRTSCLCQTDISLSEEQLRKGLIQPRE